MEASARAARRVVTRSADHAGQLPAELRERVRAVRIFGPARPRRSWPTKSTCGSNTWLLKTDVVKA